MRFRTKYTSSASTTTSKNIRKFVIENECPP